VIINDLRIVHGDSLLLVDLDLGLKELKVEGTRAFLLTPRLQNEGVSLDLASVGVYGRQRYYHYIRGGESMLSGGDELSYLSSKRPDHIAYHAAVPYEDWMDGAALDVRCAVYGCCGSLLSEDINRYGSYHEPEAKSVEPLPALHDTVETRRIERSAYLDFPVNKAEVDPSYHRNYIELAKVRAVMDSLLADPGNVITSVAITGYASPEGSYKLNERLAAGRAESIKKYILRLYGFEEDVVSTGYVPEDWAGLRSYVEGSDISNRSGILSIIDGGLSPDEKERKLADTYPQEYQRLKESCFPSLRHTDFLITYETSSESADKRTMNN